jgi:hypothetical protein
MTIVTNVVTAEYRYIFIVLTFFKFKCMYFQGEIVTIGEPKLVVTVQMSNVDNTGYLDYAKEFFKHIEGLLEKDGFIGPDSKVSYETSSEL